MQTCCWNTTSFSKRLKSSHACATCQALIICHNMSSIYIQGRCRRLSHSIQIVLLRSLLESSSRNLRISVKRRMISVAVFNKNMKYLSCALYLYYTGLLTLLNFCRDQMHNSVDFGEKVIVKAARMPLKIKNIHQYHYLGVGVYMLSSLLLPLWQVMMYMWKVSHFLARTFYEDALDCDGFMFSMRA